MSKELDYFIEMKECNQLDYGEEEFKCKAIETALKRLEAIDNTNPNEAFKIVNECLKGIDTYEEKTGRKNPPCYMSRETLNTIKQALLKAQEQEKVLKILFEKNVNIASLKAYDLEEYNMVYENKLTEEEFDLLKRYLN